MREGYTTMDDEPIKGVPHPPSEPATPAAQSELERRAKVDEETTITDKTSAQAYVEHVMERQPLHRMYGGMDTKGTLCTCEIGEDHSEHGVRLNKLPPRPGYTVPQGPPAQTRVQQAIEKLATGLTKVVNEKTTTVLTNELTRWAEEFQGYADNLWAVAKTKDDGLIGKTMRAESAVWAQAAVYLRTRIKHLQEGKDIVDTRADTEGA